jgi:cellobiose-specific phosphotransferase system component IIA
MIVCVKKYSLFLVLVLLSAQLWALPTLIVGEDSRDTRLNEQASLIEDLQADIALKESEIVSLKGSLSMYQSDSEGLLTDSTQLLKQVNELKTQLETAKSELSEAKKLLSEAKGAQSESSILLVESASELSASEALVETATDIVAVEPSPFGGFFGAGALYNPTGELAVEAYAGLSYGMFGVYAGVQSDVALDMYLPAKFTYKAGLQVQF